MCDRIRYTPGAMPVAFGFASAAFTNGRGLAMTSASTRVCAMSLRVSPSCTRMSTLPVPWPA
jgi:hypothetical protein